MKHSTMYLMNEGFGTTPVRTQAAAVRVASASSIARSRAECKLGEWSPWLRAGVVEYRYRSGLRARESQYAGSVDSMFQVRNLRA